MAGAHAHARRARRLLLILLMLPVLLLGLRPLRQRQRPRPRRLLLLIPLLRHRGTIWPACAHPTPWAVQWWDAPSSEGRRSCPPRHEHVDVAELLLRRVVLGTGIVRLGGRRQWRWPWLPVLLRPATRPLLRLRGEGQLSRVRGGSGCRRLLLLLLVVAPVHHPTARHQVQGLSRPAAGDDHLEGARAGHWGAVRVAAAGRPALLLAVAALLLAVARWSRRALHEQAPAPAAIAPNAPGPRAGLVGWRRGLLLRLLLLPALHLQGRRAAAFHHLG